MPAIKQAEIVVTTESVWFLERYLNVFDFADLFPADAFAKEGERGVPVTFKTDLGFAIVSDIDGSKMQLRNRSKLRGWERWTREHGLKAGDRIVMEKVGEREFELRLERTAH